MVYKINLEIGFYNGKTKAEEYIKLLEKHPDKLFPIDGFKKFANLDDVKVEVSGYVDEFGKINCDIFVDFDEREAKLYSCMGFRNCPQAFVLVDTISDNYSWNLDDITVKTDERIVKPFYITFGSDEQFPFKQDEYVVVMAKDEKEADLIFKYNYRHPIDESIGNYSNIYNEDVWFDKVGKHYEDKTPSRALEMPRDIVKKPIEYCYFEPSDLMDTNLCSESLGTLAWACRRYDYHLEDIYTISFKLEELGYHYESELVKNTAKMLEVRSLDKEMLNVYEIKNDILENNYLSWQFENFEITAEGNNLLFCHTDNEGVTKAFTIPFEVVLDEKFENKDFISKVNEALYYAEPINDCIDITDNL